jgi:putative acetyltransferase
MTNLTLRPARVQRPAAGSKIPPMEIRLARETDVDGIVETVQAVYDEYGFTWDPDEYHADLYDVAGHYFGRGHLFWVAILDGRVRGTVALELFDRLPSGEAGVVEHLGTIRVAGADCSLERLYVHPDARRCGLGAALTRQVVEAARERERSLMELWSDKRFEDAHRLYLRFGARIVGERVCDDPDESPEWGLALDV